MNYEDKAKYLEDLGYEKEMLEKEVFFNRQTKLAFSREFIKDNDLKLIDIQIKLASNKYICICNNHEKGIEEKVITI